MPRTLFLSICSGLDPKDTNPVFSPLLTTCTHTHIHTRASLATGRAFVSEKNRQLTCYTVASASDGHTPATSWHPRLTRQACTAALSSFHTRRGQGRESERQTDYLADTGVHKDVGGNKQADVSNEVGSFKHSRGI